MSRNKPQPKFSETKSTKELRYHFKTLETICYRYKRVTTLTYADVVLLCDIVLKKVALSQGLTVSVTSHNIASTWRKLLSVSSLYDAHWSDLKQVGRLRLIQTLDFDKLRFTNYYMPESLKTLLLEMGYSDEQFMETLFNEGYFPKKLYETLHERGIKGSKQVLLGFDYDKFKSLSGLGQVTWENFNHLMRVLFTGYVRPLWLGDMSQLPSFVGKQVIERDSVEGIKPSDLALLRDYALDDTSFAETVMSLNVLPPNVARRLRRNQYFIKSQWLALTKDVYLSIHGLGVTTWMKFDAFMLGVFGADWEHSELG